MNLYLQVLSQCQSPDAVRLLLLPSELHSNQTDCHMQMSTGGRVEAGEFASAGKAVERIQGAKFNQLEVVYRIPEGPGLRIPGSAVSVAGVFTPSPTSDLWFRVADWPAGGERAVRIRKMNAKAAETALTYYKVTRKPSIFEVAVEVDTSHPYHVMLDACAKWLANFIPASLGSLAVFGCVDAGGPEFSVKFESNVLTTEHVRIMAKLLPPAYPELGQRFDTLHPVMFGSKKVCQGIGLILGKDAQVIVNPAISDFAVIRLGPKMI